MPGIAYLRRILPFLESWSKKFITLHARPMFASVGTWSDPLRDEPPTAIVMQGPLLIEKDFTLETVKLYRTHFPSAALIVSTWEGEDEATIATMREAGAAVLTHSKPSPAGQQNINFQLVSSRGGIEEARRGGALYVLKTRTDQRIYAPSALEFLRNLLVAFPCTVSGQEKRVVGLSFNTYKYRPYYFSDMLLFGATADLERYFSAELVEAGVPTGICESYLCTEFLKKAGASVEWTIASSWQAYAERFSVIDAEMIDLYWHKYERHLHSRFISYDGIRANRKLSFLEWLNLYAARTNKSHIPEEALSLRTKDFLRPFSTTPDESLRPPLD